MDIIKRIEELQAAEATLMSDILNVTEDERGWLSLAIVHCQMHIADLKQIAGIPDFKPHQLELFA